MVAIVALHTLFFLGNAADKTTVAYLEIVLRQAMKFGTIGFFLISGFLLGEGMTRTGRLKYFRRRVKAVFVPWVFWGCVWFVIAVSSHLLQDGAPGSLETSLHGIARQYFHFVFLQSIYWFVPNFVICLAVVLALYGRLPDSIQGPVLLAFSLFYGVNAYLNVIEPRHTAAIFGFMFYLWLGSYAYQNHKALSRWLDRTSWARLASYAAIAAMLALAEYHVLRARSSVDPANTLRISNQAFSVFVALLIVKCKRSLCPSWIEVRTETFGIFLLHPILIELYQMNQVHIPALALARMRSNGLLMIGLGVVFGVVVYLTSLSITKQIRKVPGLRWMVGR